MHKLIIRLLLFGIVIFITLEIGGRFDSMDKQYNNNPNIIRAVTASKYDSLDILFVGSSASYSGINPLYFDSAGLKTYNLSVAAAGPYFYEVLVNDYLRSVTKKPKSIFLLLLPSTFMNDMDDFSSFGIHRFLHYPLSNEQIVQKYSGWPSYPSLVMKSFQKGIKNLVHIDKVSTPIAKQTIEMKGFYPSDETTSAAVEAEEAKGRDKWKTQHFDTSRFNYLLQYVYSLKKQDIRVVFFSVPSNKLNNFFNSQYLADYQKAVTAISVNHIFLHLENTIVDSLDYRDADHLNNRGASVVTKALIAEIFKNRELDSLYHHPGTVKN